MQHDPIGRPNAGLFANPARQATNQSRHQDNPALTCITLDSVSLTITQQLRKVPAVVTLHLVFSNKEVHLYYASANCSLFMEEL